MLVELKCDVEQVLELAVAALLVLVTTKTTLLSTPSLDRAHAVDVRLKLTKYVDKLLSQSLS